MIPWRALDHSGSDSDSDSDSGSDPGSSDPRLAPIHHLADSDSC